MLKKINQMNWSRLFSHFLTSLSTSNSILTSHPMNLNGEQNPMIHNAPDSRGDFIDCWIDTSIDIRFIVQLSFRCLPIRVVVLKIDAIIFTSFWTHNKSCQIPLNSFKHGFRPKAPLSSCCGLQVHLRSVISCKIWNNSITHRLSNSDPWSYAARELTQVRQRCNNIQRRKHLHI